MEPSKEEIEDLRNSFLSLVQEKGQDAIHPKDIQRVKESDDYLSRFLKHTDKKKQESLNMMWSALTWRKDFQTNEINHHNINMEILTHGGFFPRGKDKDGATIFVFKCKRYTKGQHSMDEMKRCVVYWFERLEKDTNGKPITIFFDMEGCGLANMDLEFTKYLINLFKDYYPYFLNYILIFEMPWILNAAFKIIKSWLPEKAVQKIHFLNHKDIKDYVPLDQALKSWGGQDDYVFSFIPVDDEDQNEPTDNNLNSISNKKVHFIDGSPVSDSPPQQTTDGETLIRSNPPSVLKFVKEDNEIITYIELQNTSNFSIAYKVKTTSPERFKVRPGSGCLNPGLKTTVTVSLLSAYKTANIGKDKFLILTTPVDNVDLSPQELTNLWKNSPGKKVYQLHLKCLPLNDVTRNGSVASVASEGDQLNKLMNSFSQLRDCHVQLNQTVNQLKQFQLATLVLVAIVGVLVYVLSSKASNDLSHCYSAERNLP